MPLPPAASVTFAGFQPTMYALQARASLVEYRGPTLQQTVGDIRTAAAQRFAEAVSARRLVIYGNLVPSPSALAQRFPASGSPAATPLRILRSQINGI